MLPSPEQKCKAADRSHSVEAMHEKQLLTGAQSHGLRCKGLVYNLSTSAG